MNACDAPPTRAWNTAADLRYMRRDALPSSPLVASMALSCDDMVLGEQSCEEDHWIMDPRSTNIEMVTAFSDPNWGMKMRRPHCLDLS